MINESAGGVAEWFEAVAREATEESRPPQGSNPVPTAAENGTLLELADSVRGGGARDINSGSACALVARLPPKRSLSV